MGLHSDLSGIIPDHLITFLPDGYEVIGDIVIISFPQEIDVYTQDIIRSILFHRPSVKTILKKAGKRSGEFRTSEYIPIFGDTTLTEHKESGYRYKLDLSHVFFTGKLVFERKRIEELISYGESVLVPFAGVGPFAIPPAAHGANVIAIEKSPYACHWLNQNIRLNHVSSNTDVIQADAKEAHIYLKRLFDRIIIPGPYGGDDHLFNLLLLVKPGGIVHWITFNNKKQIAEKSKSLEDIGFNTLRLQRCGNVAPSVSRWILDLMKD